MGQIDIALNGYFRNEECADFINAVCYDGKEVLSQIQQASLGDMILNHEIKVFTPSEQESFEKFKTSLRVVFETLMLRNDEEALEEYLQSDLGIDQSTADVINALVGSDFNVEEKEDFVSMKTAYNKILDRHKEEAREEGRSEGRRETIAVLIGLYEDGILTKSTLLTRAKDGGILDDVLKQLEAVEEGIK